MVALGTFFSLFKESAIIWLAGFVFLAFSLFLASGINPRQLFRVARKSAIGAYGIALILPPYPDIFGAPFYIPYFLLKGISLGNLFNFTNLASMWLELALIDLLAGSAFLFYALVMGNK